MIRLSGVGKTYPDGTVAVRELGLDIAAGELVVLVGPSGCGKSTTLKMINRLIEPTTGTIEIDGADVTARTRSLRRGIGYVIQQIGLFHPEDHHQRDDGALLYGESKVARQRAKELPTWSGWTPRRPATATPPPSGGQQQRVGVAPRREPPVLMDEPGAVDPVVRVRSRTSPSGCSPVREDGRWSPTTSTRR
jgi:osmoprotectant transport system ATP-binding protein